MKRTLILLLLASILLLLWVFGVVYCIVGIVTKVLGMLVLDTLTTLVLYGVSSIIVGALLWLFVKVGDKVK